jgi:MFS family permease
LTTPPPPKKRKFFYGWIVVAVVAAGGFSASTESYPVLGVFLKPITDDLGWSRAAFTAPLSIGGLLGGVLALLLGPLVDRYGSRWALSIAFALLGMSFILMSLMGELWQYTGIQIIARSMNTGVLAVAMSVIIPNWFLAKRGKAISLGAIGFPIGAAVMPLYAQGLTSLWGWRAATVGAGILIWVVSLLPSALLLRRRPEDIGLLPDGAEPVEETGPNARPTADLRSGPEEPTIRLGTALRMPTFYYIQAAGSLWWFGRTGVGLHAIPFFTDQGLSAQVAVAALVVHSLFAVPGTFAAGYLRDRYSVRWIMSADYALNALAFVLVLFADTTLLVMVWAVFYGFVQGAANPLQRLIFADYFGRRHLGSIEGVSRAVQNIAQAAGPLVAAAVYDSTNSYRVIFTIFIGMNLAAMVFIAMARAPKRDPLFSPEGN